MNFTRGTRDKLSKYIDVNAAFCVSMKLDGPAVYDFCCFGLDGERKLSDDRYMVFYNQPASPGREVCLTAQPGRAEFQVNLSRLPQTIERLVFTCNIDGAGTMSAIRNHRVVLSQNGRESISIDLSGADFREEKAIISLELYRKGEWRAAAVASGFNGGLSALLKSFGGTEETQPVPAPPVQPSSEEQFTKTIMRRINLSKDRVNLEKHVVNLSKCVVNLKKENGVDLGSVRAKVAVVLDYSGSMYSLYMNGTVQRTINRLVPLGLTFDDNGSIDVYLFQSDYRKIPDLDLSNYERYVTDVIQREHYPMGGTSYAPVLQAILKGVRTQDDPTFVLFITDGENVDRSQTNKIILKASTMNLFIQFIGIGDERFRYLQQLDDLPGRTRDNTGFSKMASLDSASDSELYTAVLKQFSAWLKGQQ